AVVRAVRCAARRAPPARPPAGAGLPGHPAACAGIRARNAARRARRTCRCDRGLDDDRASTRACRARVRRAHAVLAIGGKISEHDVDDELAVLRDLLRLCEVAPEDVAERVPVCDLEKT